MAVDSKIPELASATAVLTVEIEVNELERHGGRSPPPLDRAGALKLMECVTTDLASILGDVEQFGFVLSGALYDQTELLRPGFPIADALETVFSGSMRGRGYRPQRIALGLDEGDAFPISTLNPERAKGAGPLLLVPFAFVGPVQEVRSFSENLERLLLHRGIVSQQTRSSTQQLFDLRTRNVSYATLADLCALLSVQLEQNGFEKLWSLLEHGFLGRQNPIAVKTREGNVFVGEGSSVWSPYYTFDRWAVPDRDASAHPDPEDSYVAWTRTQRQHQMALSAYGYRVQLVLPPAGSVPSEGEDALVTLKSCSQLSGDWYCESPVVGRFSRSATGVIVTNHFHEDLGTIAYTVETVDSSGKFLNSENFYPLAPGGLGEIVSTIERRVSDEGLARQILHPERIVFDYETGRLRGAGTGQPLQEPTKH